MTAAPGPYREPPAWLAAIPGYRGYHAKEQRRQADRALREDLARRVRQAVVALQRVSADLARARRFDDLTPLDGLISRLQHLGDRLQTAPEGYRGLFDREQIDEAALEQLITFDQSLAAGVDRLGTLAGRLSAQTPGPLLGAGDGQEIQALTERLHQRLDARSTVIEQGQALPAEAALAVLAEPEVPRPPIAPRLGDAVSYGSTDYVVDATVQYRGDRTWSEYRLRDASAERWLLVLEHEAYLLERVTADVPAGQDGPVDYQGRAYRPVAAGQATASLSGPSGQRQGVAVTFRDLTDDAGNLLAVRDWGAERQVLHGPAIERELLVIYPRG